MKKITNPWSGMEGYRCFGCDPHSERGLRMEFYEDGDEIMSVWHPRPEFQGWVDTLHGGIQATLADEISSWVVFRKYQTSGVTTKMEVRYHRPIHTTDERITLRAVVRQQRRNLVSAAQPPGHIDLDLHKRAVAVAREMEKILVDIHQSLIVASIDKSYFFAYGIRIHLERQIHSEHRQIMGIQNHVFITSSNPAGTVPSCLAVRSHKTCLKPRLSNKLITLVVPHLDSPVISAFGLQRLSTVQDIL